jgi:Nucleotidyl transferase AbiEii toxin, Type IV TA system
VLLETGYSGGYEPAEMVTIEPILCRALAIDSDEYEDTKPFQIRALEPRRTLIEKLFALHHVATLYLDGGVRDNERFGRHYYDVYKLLDHNPTTTKLERDRERFEELASDAERVSRLHFGGATPRPEGGFATSPAFAPRSRELRGWLEGKFSEALELLPRQATGPRSAVCYSASSREDAALNPAGRLLLRG